MEDIRQKSNKKDPEIDTFDFIDGKMSYIAMENLQRRICQK